MRTTITTAGPSQRTGWRQAVAILAAGLMGLGFVGLGSQVAQADDSPSVTNVNLDYTAPQGGQWTFQATGFAEGGTLDVFLDSEDGELLRSYQLDGNGDAGITPPDYTRVPLPAALVDVDDHVLYFVDNDFNVVEVPIEVTAPAAVTVTTASSGIIGGSLTVSGAGWVTTSPLTDSAIVALKIEQASDSSVTYNHISGYPADGDISLNLTIWAYARPDANGDFSVTITLPSGTTGADGSNPEFEEGSYRVRALAGSLQTGDRAGVALSAVFTVS